MLVSAETRKALATVKRVKRAGLALAAVLAASSILFLGAAVAPGAGGAAAAAVTGTTLCRARAAGLAAACGAVCSLALGAAALVLEGHFYTNFERHAVLG